MRKRGITIMAAGVLAFSCASKKETTFSKSEFLADSVYSKYLSEYRKHNVYLPKGFDKKKKYSIVYATDGNTEITNLKAALDSLIDNQSVKPFIFVASFANDKIADSTSTSYGNGQKVHLNYRNFEYVNSWTEDPLLIKRFPDHMSYFTEEFIPAVEKKYGQHLEKEDRYFYGVSNGAGFGLSLLNKNPDAMGTYICFSTFGGNIQTNTWDDNIKYPNLYLRYGTEEPFFLKEDADFLKSKYKELNLFIEEKEYSGGHKNRFWKEAFIEIIGRLLPNETIVP